MRDAPLFSTFPARAGNNAIEHHEIGAGTGFDPGQRLADCLGATGERLFVEETRDGRHAGNGQSIAMLGDQPLMSLTFDGRSDRISL